MATQHESWISVFDGYEPVAFPDLTGLSTAARKELSGHNIVEGTIDLDLTSGDAPVPLDALLLTAWVRLHATYSGESDISTALAHDSDIRPTRVAITASSTNSIILNGVQSHLSYIKTLPSFDLNEAPAILTDSDDRLYDTVLSVGHTRPAYHSDQGFPIIYIDAWSQQASKLSSDCALSFRFSLPR